MNVLSKPIADDQFKGVRFPRKSVPASIASKARVIIVYLSAELGTAVAAAATLGAVVVEVCVAASLCQYPRDSIAEMANSSILVIAARVIFDATHPRPSA